MWGAGSTHQGSPSVPGTVSLEGFPKRLACVVPALHSQTVPWALRTPHSSGSHAQAPAGSFSGQKRSLAVGSVSGGPSLGQTHLAFS